MSLLDRYECSISGCTWTYTRPSLPTQAEIDRALQIGPAAAHGECVRRVDAILREHFESHTLVEWFTEVQQLRAKLAKIGETRDEWRFDDGNGWFTVSRKPLSDADVRYLRKTTGRPVEHRVVGEWCEVGKET